jgi:hypothetical protein
MELDVSNHVLDHAGTTLNHDHTKSSSKKGRYEHTPKKESSQTPNPLVEG